ncbi:alpha-amylase family glycosyl hydrolase [uncultured Clostridium sp.]|uniref:alpha-amylase family glycosyl hydrolase n=1 Tax=uncultured Clostridium sp. TaxID=59620 RepID=UPI0025D157EF|nr:alpha-amylase family glycosyl hydrolase [uncultured Clostridium sp.]
MKKLYKKLLVSLLAFTTLFTTLSFGSSKYISSAYAAGDTITIHVEKPSNWSEIWIWYDSDLSTSAWDTTSLKQSPGNLTEYRTGWYKKTLPSSKVQFLFNDGTWNNKLTNSGKDFTTTSDIWIKKDGSISYTDPVSQSTVNTSIKVHFKSSWGQPNIYYWNTSPSSSVKNWPGTSMTSEGNNWYYYEIPNVSSANLIFNGNGNQTGDLSRTAGEWWFKDNQWYSSNPENVFDDDDKEDDKDDDDTDDGDKDVNTGDRTDFRDETIYFVMTSRFYDGDSSNNVHCWDDAKAGNPDSDPAWRGDFQGLIDKLDYIKALGFTAIWITPVVENASGYDYHGYHAIDFSQVDPRYESEGATYQDLIDAAHEKGLKIIQDIVLNHTGNFGEENLFPLFEKDYSTEDTADNLVLIDFYNRLPSNYQSLTPSAQYNARITAMKEGINDTENIYHHEKSLSWEGYTVQTGQIAGDCVDLNTENPKVIDYLVDSYTKYINMGVDAFRLDTVKHISRLTLNNEYIPAFKAAGGEDFYMFGEVATRYRQVWNNNIPAISTPFYTWKETKDYSWSTLAEREQSTLEHWNDNQQVNEQPTSKNHLLNGNTYHTTDESIRSGLDVIDFPMHWNFNNARDAFNVAVSGDQYYSDATWNVTYVDSHDYAPDCAPENQRFAGSQDTWAENLNLMFTFRGIPAIYYGSEIEFMKGAPIDVGPNAPLSTTGRAYFGDNIEGSVNVTDFAQYTSATGAMAETLNHPLSKHIQRLNLIRSQIPALRKGQYSTENVSGDMAFKRRYTNEEEGVDSFVCVSITNGATFNNIPNGKYVDAITGDVKNVTNGTLSIPSVGKGNMRIYVLDLPGNSAPGKIGEAGAYLK